MCTRGIMGIHRNEACKALVYGSHWHMLPSGGREGEVCFPGLSMAQLLAGVRLCFEAGVQ